MARAHEGWLRELMADVDDATLEEALDGDWRGQGFRGAKLGSRWSSERAAAQGRAAPALDRPSPSTTLSLK